MKDNNVHEYYKSDGWKKKDGVFEDQAVNENLDSYAAEYNSNTRNRIMTELNKLPEHARNRLLDCASGPVHFKEYIDFSKRFKQRYCVDFSQVALLGAKKNLENSGQNDGVFICENLLEKDFEKDFFDAAISLHTLYHVNLDEQEEFVKRLINSVSDGGKVIVVYSNPFSLRAIVAFPIYIWHLIKQLIKFILIRLSLYEDKKLSLYFKRKNIFWWRRFGNYGSVDIKTYRFFTPSLEKKLIPNTRFGKMIYSALFHLENCKLSTYLADYYMVVINKDSNMS